MKSLLIILPAAVTVVATALEQPAEDPILGVDTVHGCYASKGELQLNGTSAFNSRGSCAEDCLGVGAYVAAMQANACYCGNEYPPASTLVDDSKCSEPCPGFGTQACGGLGTYTVINTGLQLEVQNSTDSSSSSQVSMTSSSISNASSSSSVAPVVTISGTRTTATAAATESSSTGTSSTGTSAESSGSASASSSPVAKSGAVSQFSLGSFNMAVLGLGAMLLM